MWFAQAHRSLDPPFVIALVHNGFRIPTGCHESIFITTKLLNVCYYVPFLSPLCICNSSQFATAVFLCHVPMKVTILICTQIVSLCGRNCACLAFVSVCLACFFDTVCFRCFAVYLPRCLTSYQKNYHLLCKCSTESGHCGTTVYL